MTTLHLGARVGAAVAITLILSAAPAAAQEDDGVQTTPTIDYEVVVGDTLGVIAGRNHVSIADVVSWNPAITDPDRILAGQVLRLYQSNEIVHPLMKLVDVPDDSGDRYTVVPGDTLSGIAVRHGVKLRDLFTLNSRPNPNLIYPGEVLVIPASD